MTYDQLYVSAPIDNFDSSRDCATRLEIYAIIEQIENKLIQDFHIAFPDLNDELNNVIDRAISPIPLWNKVREISRDLKIKKKPI